MLRIDRLPHLLLSCLFWLGGLGISCGQSPVLERVFMPNAVADISAGMVYLPMEITYTAPDRLKQVDLVFTSATGDKLLSGWKSATLLPGTWEPVTPVTVSGKQRFLLDPPAPGRPQQFLRLTVGP